MKKPAARKGRQRRLWWLSWYQPTPDERPLKYPPNAAVLGWWNSGQRCDDDAWTICALVSAPSEAAAKKAIRIDWPEAQEWRFCETYDVWSSTDRFPLEPWMTKRMKKIRVPVKVPR